MNVLNIVREAVINKAVKACVWAYADILASSQSKTGKLLKEDQRRNQLVYIIRKNKEKYKFDYIITTESGEFELDKFNTIGRIDIGIFYKSQEYKQEYLSFECKRFIKDNSGDSAIDKAYYKDGINRYEICKYSCDTGVGGIIAFCEDGDFEELKSKIMNVLNQHSIGKVIDESKSYNHKYVHSCMIQDKNKRNIKIISILMDFAKR